MARRRGALAGPLLMLLGAWGAVIPFVSHYFGYGYTPDDTWTWTAARGWLEVLPGCAAFVGGAIVTFTAYRPLAMLGGWLAAAAGQWFVLGTIVTPTWWNPGDIGLPVGDANVMIWDRIGMFTGLGVLISAIAMMSVGRASLAAARDMTRDRIDAYRRIEEAPAYPAGEKREPTNIDLAAAEAAREQHTTRGAAH
jgi:hypothetical protein